MTWSNRYIGIPYADFGRTREGCDCWGLVCVVYRASLGIVIPDYLGAYSSTDEHAEIASIISAEKDSPLWVPVTGKPRPFNLALFRRGRWSTHVGIVIRPGLMIHMVEGDCAKVQTYLEGPYKHRFEGHYRYVNAPVKYASEVAP